MHGVWWNPVLADVFTAFETSNFLSGKLIVIILLAASALAWSVMVTKTRELRLAQSESDRFQRAFRGERQPLAIFLRRQAFGENPLFRIYESGCAALCNEVMPGRDITQGLYPGEMHQDALKLNALQVEVVRRAAERCVADQALVLEGKMGFLMTAVSSAPLLGLLGTVWGVLDAFGEMAVKGMANLSAVAPGISGALLTTVVGLLVALPSSIGYNLLAGRIRKLAVQMDNFSQEFVAELQRAYQQT